MTTAATTGITVIYGLFTAGIKSTLQKFGAQVVLGPHMFIATWLAVAFSIASLLSRLIQVFCCCIWTIEKEKEKEKKEISENAFMCGHFSESHSDSWFRFCRNIYHNWRMRGLDEIRCECSDKVRGSLIVYHCQVVLEGDGGIHISSFIRGINYLRKTSKCLHLTRICCGRKACTTAHKTSGVDLIRQITAFSPNCFWSKTNVFY